MYTWNIFTTELFISSFLESTRLEKKDLTGYKSEGMICYQWIWNQDVLILVDPAYFPAWFRLAQVVPTSLWGPTEFMRTKRSARVSSVGLRLSSVINPHSLILSSQQGRIDLTLSILPCPQGWISWSIPVDELMMRRMSVLHQNSGVIGKSIPSALDYVALPHCIMLLSTLLDISKFVKVKL